MYDPEFFFVPNPINRYNLSQRNTFLTNPDGSVDLYLQAESPGSDKEGRPTDTINNRNQNPNSPNETI